MANKKILKKQIKQICGDLATEIVISKDKAIDREKAMELFSRVAYLQNSSLSKASFAFDKSRKDFPNDAEYNKAKEKYNRSAFNSLKNNFNQSAGEIVDELDKI